MVNTTLSHRCEALIAAVGVDQVLLPGTAGYDASLESYFSPQAAAVHPACFVTPRSVEDVSAIVKSLTSLDNGGPCDFAIRAGGHTWFADANSAPHGITLDLRGLHSIDLSADKSSVSVGTGATWDAIYTKLDILGLSVAGGRVAVVGVGGLILGGGISYFGPREGWTCNQATSFEVVLADGSIVEANEQQNADLWWGLRGGSNNFGIVTRVNLPTFKQGLLWSISAFNPLSELDKQVRIYTELMAAENYDVSASFLTGWAFVSAYSLTVILNELVYTRPVGDETPALYKPILDLPAISIRSTSPVIANMSTIALNSVSLQPPRAARYMSATTTFVPTEAMIRAAYDAFNTSLELLQDVTGLMWAVSLEPVPPQLYTRGGTDSNALGLTGRNDTLVVCLVSPSWKNAAQDEQVYGAARSLMADIDSKARNLGVYVPYIYLDYAAPWQDVIESYGEKSVKKLQQLRQKVDPQQIFTKNVRGGFKIPQRA